MHFFSNQILSFLLSLIFVSLGGNINLTLVDIFPECGLGLEWGPPSLVRTIGLLLDGEVADLIKKLDIIRLDGA